jgi:hypothetical protein
MESECWRKKFWGIADAARDVVDEVSATVLDDLAKQEANTFPIFESRLELANIQVTYPRIRLAMALICQLIVAIAVDCKDEPKLEWHG